MENYERFQSVSLNSWLMLEVWINEYEDRNANKFATYFLKYDVCP
jgi:hypothetical protein